MSNDKKILIAVIVTIVAVILMILTRHTLTLGIKEWLHFIAGILFGIGIGVLISLTRRG